MRKRRRNSRPQTPKSVLPTLIIMVVLLIVILFFGRNIGNIVASIFVENSPQVDVLPEKVNAVSELDEASAHKPQDENPLIYESTEKQNSGEIIRDAFRESAQKFLPLLTPARSE